jgi:hypothetical protein
MMNRSRRFLSVGTDLILPVRGDPLRSATSFLLEYAPVNCCSTLPLAHKQVIYKEQNLTSR